MYLSLLTGMAGGGGGLGRPRSASVSSGEPVCMRVMCSSCSACVTTIIIVERNVTTYSTCQNNCTCIDYILATYR